MKKMMVDIRDYVYFGAVLLVPLWSHQNGPLEVENCYSSPVFVL